MSRKYFYPFLFLYSIAVIYLAWTTPISPHEAKIFYTGDGLVSLLMQGGKELFGEMFSSSFISIRIFFLLIGFVSIFLYYRMTWIYLKNENDRHLATAVYMLLPGMITALVLANISILVIPLVLLFLLAYDKKWVWAQAFLMLLLFVIHDASVIFFISIFIYAIFKRELIVGLISGFFLLLTIVIDSGVEIGGRPSGHFADIFGLYAALFSPLLFVYFFYTLYRILLREEKNILWYISFIALIVSLILSIRQRVSITDFAPYVVISVVLMLDIFNRSVYVRLPEYQKRYKQGFMVVMAVLVITALTIVFHQAFFPAMKDPRDHFAYKLYQPYWLAQKLKNQNINCYDTSDRKMQYQLRFYGVKGCLEEGEEQ
ncbi:MAG: hypothetical protein U9Q90_04060 [Campylobacterota bacterium]|nr:hypothetical protein [Campylobacterota bacterium]